MHPSPFEYVRPASLDQTIQLLQQYGDEAKLLAGGHSLIPLMKLRFAAPPVIVDIGRLDGLKGVQSNGNLQLGALTTYDDLLQSREAQQAAPLLIETASQVGDTQVRNRGTIGGAAAHADPVADMPAALLALGAQFTAQGPNGDRSIGADDFFQGPFTTALQPDEVLTHITVPALTSGAGAAYEKFRNPASGYAVVGVAALLTVANGVISEAKVALTGVGSHAVRATAVEDALRGQAPNESAIAEASQHATDGQEVLGDVFASPEYRARMAVVYTQRAIQKALQRAG